MNLANVFVELVVTGFHTLVWIGLLVLAFTGYQQIDFEKLVTINLAIPFVSITYIFGIVFDKLADSMFIKQDHLIREKHKPKDLPPLLNIRFYILSKSKETYEQLEYVRSRMRITRAAIINFALTTIAALVFFRAQLHDVFLPEHIIFIYIALSVVGLLLSFLSYKAWIALTRTYVSGAVAAYKVLSDSETLKDKTPKNETPENDFE